MCQLCVGDILLHFPYRLVLLMLKKRKIFSCFFCSTEKFIHYNFCCCWTWNLLLLYFQFNRYAKATPWLRNTARSYYYVTMWNEYPLRSRNWTFLQHHMAVRITGELGETHTGPPSATQPHNRYMTDCLAFRDQVLLPNSWEVMQAKFSGQMSHLSPSSIT